MKKLSDNEKLNVKIVLNTTRECLKSLGLEIHKTEYYGLCLVDKEDKKLVAIINDEEIDKVRWLN